MLGKLIRAFFNKEKITKFRQISFLSSFLNSTIGAFSKVYSFCKISDAKIGSYTYVSYWCIVNNCEIGNYCSLARGVKIGLGKHPSDFISTSPIFYSTQNPLSNVFVAQQKFTEFEKTIIANDVWIGVNALILDGVTIGDGAIVGANAVVTKDVPPFAIVGGSPAKIIRYRFSDDIIEKLLKTKWWDKEIGELQSSIALFQQPVSEEIINKLTNGNA